MYNFIDVTEVSDGNVLPAEALKLNGEYIENLITGYKTLNVTGREALSPDVETYSTGSRDGSRIKTKRYPERIITVTYQLIAESNEAFREAYNKLGGILNVEDAELIFNDEQDKFFIGTPCIIGSVDAGRNSVIGEFEILCADPFKYSVIEYEATPNLEESSILIDYNGTYKAFPTLEADFFTEEESTVDGETVTTLTGGGDCGYVAFFTEDEKIIQLGNPDEADGAAVAKSQTLINNSFKTSTGWGSAAKSQWRVNSGITADVIQAGNVGMAVASYASTVKNTTGTLLNVASKASKPVINYKVTAKTSNRTASAVKVVLTITTSLDRDSNFFGRGYGLKGHIYIGGAWHTVTIKDTSTRWEGKSGHAVSLTVTVNGLSQTTNSLTGIKFKVSRIDSLGSAGLLDETACSNLAISQYATAAADTYYLVPTGYGTGNGWHGASITRTIPADATGESGAVNFTLSYSQALSIGVDKNATNQFGAFQILLVNGSGSSRNVVAGVNIYKAGNGKTAKLRFYVGNHVVQTIDIDVSYGNKYFKMANSSTITKSGETVTFNICGIKKTFKDADIATTAVNEVTVVMAQYGTKPALKYNGLYWVKFVKNNCDTWKDIPNKFSANDVVIADCKNGEIYLNGVLNPALGALGNDWESFYLTQGLNQIGVSYSDWVSDENAPNFKIRYREVYL